MPVVFPTPGLRVRRPVFLVVDDPFFVISGGYRSPGLPES